MKLLSRNELERSPIVANNRMNRERGLSGVNSYQKDLGLDVLEYLLNRVDTVLDVRWMDLCCGRGKALIEAAGQIRNSSLSERIQLEGLDLVGMFDPYPMGYATYLSLKEGSIQDWQPEVSYDLITCVHGLHYVGDKIGSICHALQQLTPNGQFWAHLDPQNIRDDSGKAIGNSIISSWKTFGCEFQSRKRILKCRGKQTLPDNWEYLGADDTAGPNYTGQEAVNSYYRFIL